MRDEMYLNGKFWIDVAWVIWSHALFLGRIVGGADEILGHILFR